MGIKAASAALLAFAVLGQAQADPGWNTAGQYATMKATPSMKDNLGIYLAAAGSALFAANFELAAKKHPLFCAPDALYQSLPNYQKIFERELRIEQASTPAFQLNDTPDEIILLRGFEQRFPCPK
jgi:hypothetical protein